MDNSRHVGNEPCFQAVFIVFTTMLAIISLAAFIGNILVMMVAYQTPSLRTSTNYNYVNMAVSDFLSSLTLWPLYLTDEIITLRGSLRGGPIATVGCINIPHCRTTFRKFSIRFQGPTFFNSLSREIQNSESISLFGKRLKKFLLS